MNLTRRFFLGAGLSAGVIALTAPKIILDDSLPVLWGDGVHDDAAGLEAFLNRRPFRIARQFGGYHDGATIDGASLRLGRTVKIGDAPKDAPMIWLRNTRIEAIHAGTGLYFARQTERGGPGLGIAHVHLFQRERVDGAAMLQLAVQGDVSFPA